jgi:hypothetical protein
MQIEYIANNEYIMLEVCSDYVYGHIVALLFCDFTNYMDN